VPPPGAEPVPPPGSSRWRTSIDDGSSDTLPLVLSRESEALFDSRGENFDSRASMVDSRPAFESRSFLPSPKNGISSALGTGLNAFAQERMLMQKKRKLGG
jgi:hypothetical protein